MQKLLLAVGLTFIFQIPAFAQEVEAPLATDVVFRLETEGGGKQFHLGELIPIKFFYSSENPGRYSWVSQSRKLIGGRSVEISCSAPGEPVSRIRKSPDVASFEQMLHAPCSGVGGGVGGGCGDCDDESPLTTVPLTFGIVPLNTYVRFRTSGTYTCEASSAEITATSRDEKIRPALLVKSNPLVVTISEDSAWAHSAVAAYANVYDKLCRGDNLLQRGVSLQCFDVAQRLRYLDTSESLATEVRLFDGRAHGWEPGFWDAIQDSSYPREALRLMTSRILEPDFEASAIVLEWLATLDLRLQVPDAFETRAAETYHARAVEMLRKYTRLLGNSLPQKSPTVLQKSVVAYRVFAEQHYCEQQPLIPAEENNQVLWNAGVK